MINYKQVAKWQHALATTLTPIGIRGWERKLTMKLKVYRDTNAPLSTISKISTQLASIREAIRLANLRPDI
jgi:hypothetical protein